MPQETPTAPPAPTRRLSRGYDIVAVWAVAVALVVWAGPWPASTDRLAADVAGGRVTAWSLQYESPADPIARSGVLSWAGLDFHRSRGEADTVVWRDTLGRVRYAVVRADAPQLDARTVATDRDAARRDWLMRVAPTARQDEVEATWWLDLPLGVLRLGVLMLLVTGRPPRHGTRWFWFWIGAGLPLGLGIALFVLFEYGPWARAVPAEPRRTGGRGFLLALLGSLAVGLPGAALVALLMHLAGA